MSQLVKHENLAPSKFEQLAQSPKLSSLDKPTLKMKLTEMMQHATILNGGTKEPDASIFEVHINSIYEDIMTVHSWLTVAELQTVFKEGLRGKYGEFFGLNYKTVSDWIVGYRDSPERKSYLESKKVFLPAPAWTKEQKERDDRDYLQFNYDNYSDKTTLPMIDPQLYGIIRKNNLDTLTQEDKELIREVAKGKYEEYKDDPLMNINIEIKEPSVVIDKIAKRIATINLFNQWRQEGIVHLFKLTHD